MIELMIGLAIVAIIVSLAFPAFQGSIRKSRRAVAFAAVSAVQLAQERWRANNATYSSSVAGAWPASGLGLTNTTSGGYYTISVASATATGYDVTATAVSGQSQSEDGACAVLVARTLIGNITYGASALAGVLDFSPANRCWAR